MMRGGIEYQDYIQPEGWQAAFDPALLARAGTPAPPRRRRSPAAPDDLAQDPSTYVTPTEAPELWHNDEHDRRQGPRRRAARQEDDPEPPFADLFGTLDSGAVADHQDRVDQATRRRRARQEDDPESPFVDLFTPPEFFDVDEATKPPRARRPLFQEEDPGIHWGPTGGDVARFYLTGAAASDGAAQADQAASLGDHRSSTEASRVGFREDTPIRSLRVDQASRQNGVGGERGSIGRTGALYAKSGDLIRYAAPGGRAGAPVAVPLGESRTVADGADPSKWVRVTRIASDPFAGIGRLSFVNQMNNVFGMSDADDAESGSGGDRYRGVMVRNDALANITDLTFWVEPIGTSATTFSASLPSSGAGVITGGAEAFCDWPPSGCARVEESDGTLREIAAYTSRTDATLTVPAAGRGMLGTSAAAGDAGDVVRNVPPIRIAWEPASPAREGAVQAIADEETAPTSVGWSTAVLEADGLVASDLRTEEQGALWIHREHFAGVAATAEALTRIRCAWTWEGRRYEETLAGLYRIADEDLDWYELYVGEDGPPDFDAAPNATGATLPFDSATIVYGAGHAYHLVVRRRNRHGLRSANVAETIFTIDPDGVARTNPPSAPVILGWTPIAGGAFLLKVAYYYPADAAAIQADTYHIYATFDGSDPDPATESPVAAAIPKADGTGYYEYATATNAHGAIGKVLVRTLRSADSVESASTPIATATADADGLGAVAAKLFWRGRAEQSQ
jgi:hypothetical protein